MAAKISSTQILIESMEMFGDSEPTAAMVIWIDEKNMVHIAKNVAHHEAVGLCEFAKEVLLQSVRVRTDG